LDSKDWDFWERESWREVKRLDRVVNSWVQEDRIVFWASRSSNNFWTLSVLITNSVAIVGRLSKTVAFCWWVSDLGTLNPNWEEEEEEEEEESCLLSETERLKTIFQI
jgi:hypothetical protein